MQAQTLWVNFTNIMAQRANAFFGAIQFQQQNYTQLCQYTQLESTLNFYAVGFKGKPGVNFTTFYVQLLHT
jgi:hypothetical protein